MYTKTHGHQLLVNNLYAEGKTAIHTNSFLHGLKYLYNAILQFIIKRKLFHWKSFVVTNYSAKTAKLFHLEQFAIYSMFYRCLLIRVNYIQKSILSRLYVGTYYEVHDVIITCKNIVSVNSINVLIMSHVQSAVFV